MVRVPKFSLLLYSSDLAAWWLAWLGEREQCHNLKTNIEENFSIVPKLSLHLQKIEMFVSEPPLCAGSNRTRCSMCSGNLGRKIWELPPVISACQWLGLWIREAWQLILMGFDVWRWTVSPAILRTNTPSIPHPFGCEQAVKLPSIQKPLSQRT